MAEPPSNYMVRNALIYAYKALRHTERLGNNSLRSPYEEFYSDLSEALSPMKKLDWSIPNSEVEKFYSRRMSETEFLTNVQTKVLSKVAASGQGTAVPATSPTTSNGVTSSVRSGFGQFSLLFSVVWGLLVTQNKPTCSKLPNLSGKQLWEIFIKLDTDSELKVYVDDLVDLIIRIFQANGHKEQEENIKEWFCGEEKTDFWSFFTQLTEKFVGLLQINIVQDIHTNIVSEFLKEGKLEKKGHVVHNWKMRWFVLTASTLKYFESHDNLILKGSVVINSNTMVQSMQEFKVRPHRFRVVCGETKNGTEISAPSLKAMHDWIYTIRMAIKMHHIEGRNFLDKHRQALASVTKPYTLQSSASEDRTSQSQSPSHRGLTSSKSVPLDGELPASSHANGKQKQLPTIPDSPIVDSKGKRSTGNENSMDYNDPPPLPPQRFTASDVQSSSELFDKQAFVEARRNSRANRERGRRHSSLEPSEVIHVESTTGDYALVNKTPVKKKKGKKADPDVSSLLSQTVRAQLPPDATEQIENWEEEKKDKKEKPTAGYVQLHFHNKDNGKKGKIVPDKQAAKTPVDAGKTKFGYSTVVFEAEKKKTDIEYAEQMRQNKPPPVPPPKYEPSLPKHASDSRLLHSKNVDYSDIDFSTKSSKSPTGTSSPDLRQSSAVNGDGDESPYVNVRHGGQMGPPVPPRRGVAAVRDEYPLVPSRKIS